MPEFREVLSEECARVVEEYKINLGYYLEVAVRDLEQEFDLEEGELNITSDRLFYNGELVCHW